MTNHEDCPGPETMAALIDGLLPPSEASRVRAHVAGCPTCAEVTRESLHVLLRETADEPAVLEPAWIVRLYRRFPWNTVWLSAAAALVAMAGLLILRQGSGDDMTRLVAAVGARRIVEARITGGFAYAPLPSPERGPSPLDHPDTRNWKLWETAGRITDAAGRRGADPNATHVLGVAHLILGDVDKAIEALEKTVRARPADARALSDLAASYLARADATRRPDDIVRAIDAARHALTLDPRCDEARFNFALALEKQIASGAGAGSSAEGGAAGGPAEPDQSRAIEAWREYLRHDGDSPWAGEARSHLAALEKRSALLPVSPDPAAVEAAARQGDLDGVTRLVQGNPRQGHEVLHRHLLPAWAAAQRDHQGEAAARALAGAATLAQAIERVSGDRLGVESVQAIAGAPAGGDARASIAEGVRLYAEAIARSDDGDMRTAGAEFRSAVEAFDRGRAPLRWAAALHAAISDYYAAPGAEVRGRLDRMGGDLAARPYYSLLARVRWMQGLLGAVAGDLSRSLARYQEALALFERTHELDGVASANFLIAENLDLVGDQEEAWRHRATALGLASRADADSRRSILLEATLAALAQDRPWAALTFHEPLFEPWSAGDPGARSEAHKTRARIHAACGDPDGALADLADAERMLPSVGDPDLRRRYAAEIAESRGTTLLARDPGEAVEPLRQAGEYFASIGATSRVAELRLDLGRAHEALGSYADAESDYDGGIASLEETYSRLLTEPHRVSFVDRTWDLFDAMIRLEAESRDRPDAAFAYAERARRADLLTPQTCAPQAGAAGAPEARTSSHGPPDAGSTARNLPDAATIARGLPDGVTVVCLTVVPDRLLRWVLRAGRVEFRPQPVAPGEIAGLVRGLRSAEVEGDEAAFRDASSALYELLIRPVETLLAGTEEIRFVPDRLLNDVPYAALVDRKADSFLMERYATGVAPTALSLVSPCGRGEHAAASARVLVVGNPALDESLHADLAPLPGAEAEARQVASLYHAGTLLVGPEATAERFLTSIGSADVVHFAGHALVNERYPLLSALVLARDPAAGHADLVTTFDLQQAALARARLVVLGACRAAGGGSVRAGAAFNLARPFLAAGVPEIVGTLWAVRDREASSILVDLHREYRRGLSAVEGLRRAQLAALRGPDPAARSPLSWGAYVVNGTVLRSGEPLKKEAS